jgi:hypothetical protein
VVKVERGDATGPWSFLNIRSYNQFRYVVLCISYVKVIVNTCGF